MKTLIDHALYWASQGIPVFPCGDNKAPLTDKGFYDGVTNPAEVRALFEFYGGAAKMIGGRMGKEAGLFAVDIDLYKGKKPEEWFKAVKDEGALPETRIHKTKNGGLHLLYESDDFFPNCKPAEGVEVKGEGGYIILPGSPGYEVLQGGLVKANGLLLERLRYADRDRQSATVSSLEGDILGATDFHTALAQVAAKYAFEGWDQLRIQKRLRELLEASVAASPGHDRHSRWRAIYDDRGGELTRIVRSAFKKFNDDAINEDMAEADGFDAILADAEGVFPQLGQGPQEPDEYDTPIPEDAWPFLHQGYFADQEHNLAEQAFTMYPIYAENETVVIFAEPKTGKTAIALTTALHIACGFDYGQFKVAAGGPTLYYALEGSRAIRLRVAAWRKTMAEQNVELPRRIPMFVVERPTNFLKEDQRKAAAKQLIAADTYARKRGTPLKAIFIDTLTKAMAGGDQNSVDDTSHLFDIVSLVRAGGVTATIVFVHHKSRSGLVRGSTNIEAEPDVLLDVSKKGETVTMKIARARSIEDGLRFHFKLEGVDLGETVQGHPLAGVVAKAVIMPADTGDEDMADHLMGEKVGELRRIIAEHLPTGKHEFRHVLSVLAAQNLLPEGKKPIPSQAWAQQLGHEIASETGVVYDNRHISLVKDSGKITHLLIRAFSA